MADDLDDEDDDPMQDIESVTSTNTWDSVKYDVDMTLGKKATHSRTTFCTKLNIHFITSRP
jgi:hypothetical protein